MPCSLILMTISGIDEAFLKVAKQIVHLYETNPNSGLNTIDMYVKSENVDDDTQNTDIKVTPKPSEASAGSGCAC